MKSLKFGERHGLMSGYSEVVRLTKAQIIATEGSSQECLLNDLIKKSLDDSRGTTVNEIVGTSPFHS